MSKRMPGPEKERVHPDGFFIFNNSTAMFSDMRDYLLPRCTIVNHSIDFNYVNNLKLIFKVSLYLFVNHPFKALLHQIVIGTSHLYSGVRHSSFNLSTSS